MTPRYFDPGTLRDITEAYGFGFFYQNTVPSTMDWARENIESVTVPTIFLAGEQTRGRGRAGRSWYSPAGKGLYLSLAIKDPAVEYADACFWNFGAAEVLRRFSEAMAIPCEIKWPNDVMVRDRKLAGILVEWIQRGSRSLGLVIGWGLNLMRLSKNERGPVERISLEEWLGRPPDFNRIYRHVLKHIHEVFTLWRSGDRFKTLTNWFASWGWEPGSHVTYREGQRRKFGILKRLQADGSLWIEDPEAGLCNVGMDAVIHIVQVT